MIKIIFKTDFKSVKGEIFDHETNIKMGDIIDNEISFNELEELSKYLMKNNIKSGIPIDEETFFNLVKYSKENNILIFKDINGNYQENFNTDPEVYKYIY